MSQYINTVTEAGIATMTLDRPDLHNAFNEVVIAGITATLTRFSDDSDVRVVVFRSEGKSFSAGADIHWMKRMVDYSFDENVADARTLADMLAAIRNCSKPVIARVHGATYGGGVGIVAACDMAVAVKEALFSLSEVKLGIVPAVISPFVMEKIGPGHMRRFGLTAERFDAIEAKRIGLISEAVDSVELMDAWIEEKCRQLVANGPQALAACKRVLREVYDADWGTARDITTRRIAERRVSPEGQEGLKAFLEKRSPTWGVGR